MKKLMALMCTICIIFSFMGCEKQISNTDDLISSLKKMGYKVSTFKQGKNKFLSGDLTVVKINGNEIDIYEYKSNQEMEREAEKYIRSSDSAVNTMNDYISDPHFYKIGKIIVSYIGDKKEITKKLEKIIGEQFSGM